MMSREKGRTINHSKSVVVDCLYGGGVSSAVAVTGVRVTQTHRLRQRTLAVKTYSRPSDASNR
jgi:hypothetical protein